MKKAAMGKKTSSDNLPTKKPELRKNLSYSTPLKEINGSGGSAHSSPDALAGGPKWSKATSIGRSKSLPKVPRSAPTSSSLFDSENRSITSKVYRNPARSDLVSIGGLGSKNPRNQLKLQHGCTDKKQSTKLQSDRPFATECEKGKVSPPKPVRIPGCPVATANIPSLPRPDSPEWRGGGPSSSSTPPIQASISPEIAGGTSSMSSAAACFGTGHLIAGVRDRRKCKPRGILTVCENASERSGAKSGDFPTMPPLADASIRWLSPSPRCASEDENFSTPFEIGSLNQWNVQGDDFVTPEKITVDTSPSLHSLGFVQAPSTSESSVSPFSAIIRQAEAEAASVESSPFSALNKISLSLEDVEKKTETKNPSNLKDRSFQFQLNTQPSTSIDLAQFKNCRSGPDDERFSLEESVPSISQMRISWRDGLESRIFEMGEMELRDSANGECLFDTKHEFLGKSSGGFASEEILSGADLWVQESRNKFSESISLEDAGLFSSGDSDWSFFYKNHLFEG